VTVRKTESRLPAGLNAVDLGEAGSTPDGRCALISFVTSPIVTNRQNLYVLIVSDAGLAVAADTFEWTFAPTAAVPEVRTINFGEASYQPKETGPLTVTVRVLDAGHAEQATVSLTQIVVPPASGLENTIGDAAQQPGPGAGDPEALRELAYEHATYYSAATPTTPEPGDAFKQFLFGFLMDGLTRHSPFRRQQLMGQLADAVNGGDVDFSAASSEGLGVCGIRLPLLAMLPPVSGGAAMLNWTELPEPQNERGFAEEQLRAKLAAVSDSLRIDLFNLVRFPKTNVGQCGRILEALRDRYFSGASFQDVMQGMSGTRAHWITRHYLEGPLQTS
jgi:hypothetical protein